MKRPNTKVAFIIGPYRGATHYDVFQSIEHARRAAVKCWQKGYAVICPHLNSSWFSGSCPEDKFLSGYLELLDRSDCYVLLPGWENSEGATEERLLARDLQLEDITEEICL